MKKVKVKPQLSLRDLICKGSNDYSDVAVKNNYIRIITNYKHKIINNIYLFFKQNFDPSEIL